MTNAVDAPLFWKQFRLVCAHELRVLIADRTLSWVSALLLVMLGYGLYTGLAETQLRDTAATAFHAAQQSAEERNIADLRQVMAGVPPADPFANPADPASIGGGGAGRYAVMPTAALAPLAFGQSDMFPNSYPMSYGSKVDFMYDSEMENPWNLLSGHVDPAFVIVYLLPLLIFALSYNLLSVEREQGTLRMLLSQPLALATLVLGKISVRAGVLLGIVLLVPIIGLLLARPEARAPAQLLLLACWAALVLAYAAFWFAIAAVMNAYSANSAVNALVLAATWVLLVLVLPVSLNLAVQQWSPAPSRTELATTTRLITIAGLQRYNEMLGTDYRYTDEPGMLLPKDGRFEVHPRLQAMYLMDRDIDVEIDRVLERFDEQLAGQQQLVDRFGALSPAITMYEGMTALAGTGSKRYLHFKNLVEQFHAEWKAFFQPRMDQGLAITEADLLALPDFDWQETPADGTAATTLARALLLLAPALLLLALAWRRLRIYRPV
jgi:ABC-2 type transport system permease protein